MPLLLCAASGTLFALGMILAFLDRPDLADPAYLASALAGLWLTAPGAWRSLVSLAPDMTLLMTSAVVGAACLGDSFEAAATAFLFSFSELLESWTLVRSSKRIKDLLDKAPKTVRLLTDNVPVAVLAAEVPAGSLIALFPGDVLALDGVVESGESSVDESALTGEAVPVPKGPGEQVWAGSVNGAGALTLRTTAPLSGSAVARILTLVTEAKAAKAPVARFVDRFARVYTPAIMAASIGVALIPPLAGMGGFAEWLRRGLVLMVSGCPCALVISTPIALVCAIASAARAGVLIKGGAPLEALARTKAMAFDKTGTLTRSALAVSAARTVPGQSLDALHAVALTLESLASHPVAKAVAAYAKDQGAAPGEVSEVTDHPGLGMSGRIGDEVYYAGNSRFYERIRESAFDPASLGQPPGSLAPQAVIFTRSALIGGYYLSSAMRPESPEVIRELKRLGLARIVMLSGDATENAAPLGRKLGLDETLAGLSPRDKTLAVRRLGDEYGPTAMIGDGVNDSPALAAAGVGLAMGRGAGAAVESADITLVAGGLTRLPWLFAHCRRTMALIRANITLSLSIKAAFAVLAVTGLAELWMAVAADMGLSLAVTGNSLRLLAARPKPNGPAKG